MKPSTSRSPKLKRHVDELLRRLKDAYPDVRCSLDFADPFQLVVATVLSAQCTDVRVNAVTPTLFARYPDPATLAAAVPEELERIIHPTGFFRAKARSLIGLATAIVRDHGGQVPRELESLTALPGVGRKTAHVVLGNAFGIASGVVVDTHVKRLAYRMGLTPATDPTRVEADLVRLLPSSEWVAFSHRLIDHGRAVCRAQRPACERCPLDSICPKGGVGDADDPAAE